MNKETFLAQLREKLSGLPEDELAERIAFYSEMIDDRMADGQSEEEAVAGIGSPEEAAAQIMSEIPLTRLVGERVKHREKRSGWEIALLILGFPLWFPLLMAAAAILLSVYAVIWAVVISLWAVCLSLFAGAVGCVLSILPYLQAGNTAGVFFGIGAGLACAGLGILLFHACAWITKGVLKGSGKALLKIKKRFIGKES